MHGLVRMIRTLHKASIIFLAHYQHFQIFVPFLPSSQLCLRSTLPVASESPLQDSWRWQQGQPASHPQGDAAIKLQRDCLWELALTSVLGKEHHSLGAYKIPNSHPVQKEWGHTYIH